MSKYQLSELSQYTVDFSMAATISSIVMQNIKTNPGDKTVAKYTYAIDGNIVHESTTAEDYEQTDLTLGRKYDQRI